VSTRLQIRNFLRRRLQDQVSSGGPWDDTDLDSLIDLAAHRMQLFMMSFAPDMLIYIGKANISANDALVELPEGIWTIRMVQILGSDGGYRRIRPAGYEELVGKSETASTWDRSSATTIRYACLAEWLYLSPVPTENVVDGLRIHYVPSHSLSSDTDIPKLPLMTHMGIALQANVYALPEVGEENLATRQDLAEMKADIKNGWWTSLDEGLVLRPDIRRSLSSRRGVDPGRA